MSEDNLIKQTRLKDVKSKYIMIYISSYLDEKRKLEIIKYNKSMQNIFGIKLINYKYYTRKQINYELNGKGKEYDEYFNKIIFEGEYLKGKRNGKGKEYSDDGHKIIFEGEYKNGLRWNGKGYDNNNKVVYELKNGNGYVKEYDDKGILVLEVEYLNGKRNGKGKEYYEDDKLEFEGEYLNGFRNGKGKEYNFDDEILVFEGEYFYDKTWNGKGYDNHDNAVYELKNGKGYVKQYALIGTRYFEGE